MNPTIVAIDGPSGVGKSSTSKAVARALGIPHIDTGAMYRAIAIKAIRTGVSLQDESALTSLSRDTRIRFQPTEGEARVFLDDEDVTEQIREPEVSLAASAVSAVPGVRKILVSLQQIMGKSEGGVLEGRDIGTKVFPDTYHKFFLTARPDVRGHRRYRQLLEKGFGGTPEQVLEEMLQRDAQDSNRAESPLTCDETYEVIDTSDLSLQQVVDAIVKGVQRST